MKFLAALVLLFAVLVATSNVHFYFRTSSADAAPSEEVRTLMAVEDKPTSTKRRPPFTTWSTQHLGIAVA
jgi:hypothetical protein